VPPPAAAVPWRQTSCEGDTVTDRRTDRPDFLALPPRSAKPRQSGCTHVLDKGLTPDATRAMLDSTAHLVDVVKIGWGIAYVDPRIRERVALYTAAGVLVSLGGTLLEIAVAQGALDPLRAWAHSVGITAVEVSNGMCGLSRQHKATLIASLSTEFVVLAEVGAKDGGRPVVPRDWTDEMESDLAAGARWVIAEGRESGTVGLYRPDGTIREELVEAVASAIPLERVIFEAPAKSAQVWFVRRFGRACRLRQGRSRGGRDPRQPPEMRTR